MISIMLQLLERIDFKLANSYEDSVRNIPATVGIASTGGGGTINPINPPLNLYKDSTVTFNLNRFFTITYSTKYIISII